MREAGSLQSEAWLLQQHDPSLSWLTRLTLHDAVNEVHLNPGLVRRRRPELSAGALAGIVVGAVVATVLVGGIAVQHRLEQRMPD